MKKAVVALLQTQVQANIAVENLQMAGFNNSDISILMRLLQSQRIYHERAPQARRGFGYQGQNTHR